MAFDLDDVASGEGKELPVSYELKRPHLKPEDCLFEPDSEMAAVMEDLLEGRMTFHENEQDCIRLVGLLLNSLPADLKHRFSPLLDKRLRSMS